MSETVVVRNADGTVRYRSLSFVFLILAVIALVIFTMLAVGWITPLYKSVPNAWLGGGLTLFVAAHLL